MRVISEQQVKSILSAEKTIDLVEDAFKELSEGTAVIPQRISMTKPTPGMTLVMPGILGSKRIIGTKIVSVYPENPMKYNLPVILAKIILQDFNTGNTLAIMDGTYITKMRTGAATAVSVKYLARKDSKIIGLFGAGTQAEGQLLAVCALKDFKFDRCKLYDPNLETAEAFKTKLEKMANIKIEIQDDPIGFVDDCDLVICATTSKRPLFNGNDLKDGVHISSIGSHSPGTREIDSITLSRANIIAADSKDACLNEAGDFIIPINEGMFNPNRIVSIGDIINKKSQGRTTDSQITLFKSVGIAAQDLICANYVYQQSLEKNIGNEISD
jgi:ornithine cyclodeaminase/alanine dehydrogenase-like protein (mu-crystallin family)